MLTTLLLLTAPILSSTNPSLPEADPGVTRLLQAQAQGRSNAFDDLWLLPFDVPGNEKARIATADVERINAQLRSVEATDATAQAASAMRSLASEHYPPSPIPSSDAPPLCDLHGEDCLTRVRAAADAYTALLTQEAALLSRHNALTRHDHFHSRFSAHPRSPSLPLTRMSLPLTDAALKFVQGRTEGALQSVCEHTQAWRRIGANSDSMVVSMLATALVNGNASLYAQMRVELPADHSEPAACATAFSAPSAEELSLCTAMTGEYALHKHTTESQLAQRESAKPGTLESATFDPARTLDLTARQLGRQCSDEVLAQLRDDVRVQLPPVDIDLTSPDCVANPVGCTLADTGSEAYDSYIHRRQDMAARLRLVETVSRLRAGCSDEPVAACVARMNADSPTRPVTLSTDGTALHIALYDSRHGSHASVALPADLQPR